MCFIMDTNCLIDLNMNFPTDVFLGLWDDINDSIEQKELISIQEVYSELKSKPINDFWTEIDLNNEQKFFRELIHGEIGEFYKIEELPIFEKVIIKNGENWSLKKEWSQGTAVADPFLICHSLKHGSTIVTQENQRSQLNIPHVCKELNIECINLIQFFKQNGWKY